MRIADVLVGQHFTFDLAKGKYTYEKLDKGYRRSDGLKIKKHHWLPDFEVELVSVLKRASLSELAEMRNRGELYHSPVAPTGVPLDDGFWKGAVIQNISPSVDDKIQSGIEEVYRHADSGGMIRILKISEESVKMILQMHFDGLNKSTDTRILVKSEDGKDLHMNHVLLFLEQRED